MEEPRLSISVHNSSASGRPSGSDSAGSRKCDSAAIFPDVLFVHTREEVKKKKGNRIKGYRQGGNAPSDNCFGFYRGGFYPGSRFCVDRRGAVVSIRG